MIRVIRAICPSFNAASAFMRRIFLPPTKFFFRLSPSSSDAQMARHEARPARAISPQKSLAADPKTALKIGS
jgi:hypothetical protein